MFSYHVQDYQVVKPAKSCFVKVITSSITVSQTKMTRSNVWSFLFTLGLDWLAKHLTSPGANLGYEIIRALTPHLLPLCNEY